MMHDAAVGMTQHTSSDACVGVTQCQTHEVGVKGEHSKQERKNEPIRYCTVSRFCAAMTQLPRCEVMENGILSVHWMKR